MALKHAPFSSLPSFYSDAKKLVKDVRFEWNNSSSVTIQNLGFTRELNREAARILADYAVDYVPFETGALNSSVRITPTATGANITYMPVDAKGRSYSKYQYNLDQGNPDGKDCMIMTKDGTMRLVRRYRGVHPLATSRWVHWAYSVWNYRILKDINEERKKYRRFNQNDKY